MPNWVTNNIKFKDEVSYNLFKKLLYNIKEDRIDFTLLVPIAEELENSKADSICYSKGWEYSFEVDKKQLEYEDLILSLYNEILNEVTTREDFTNKVYKEVTSNIKARKLIKEMNYKNTEGIKYFITRHAETYYYYKKYGYVNWYKAHIDLWGTKWNCTDTYLDDDSLFCSFNTAWSCPRAIFEKLAKLNIKFSVAYADEDTGSNCGLFTTRGTKLVNIVSSHKNNTFELFAFACLVNYENMEDYIESIGGEEYLQELEDGDEDDKEFLELINKAKDYSDKMLSTIRRYDLQY